MTGVAPTPYNFTAEQRRILGEVYHLILRWRRERLFIPADPFEQNGQAIADPAARQVAFQPVEEV